MWPVNGGAKNRAAFERFLRDMREAMGRPHVSDPKLQKLMEQQYRPFAEVGSGSTAAAIRFERASGIPVKGSRHIQKGNDDLVALRNWLSANPTAKAGDRAVAENVIKDLVDALGDQLR